MISSSGDLGVTFGVIRQNDGPQTFSLFTIWRREPGGDW